jgi:ATP adenylyltransferase
MTWKLLHERMAFMAEMIHSAETDPETALDLSDKASEVTRLFGDEEGLLLSLRQRWLMMLYAKLDQADYDGLTAEEAIAELAAANPGLYALLSIASRRSLRLRMLSRGEHRVVDLFDGPVGDRQTVA